MLRSLLSALIFFLFACGDRSEPSSETFSSAGGFRGQTYKQAQVVQRSDGVTTVSSLGGGGGISLTRGLSGQKVYRLRITGVLMHNAPTLRITLDGIRSYWTTLTSETLDLPIADASMLEVLIYSDSEFEFWLSAVTIDECTTCKSTNKLDDDLCCRVR